MRSTVRLTTAAVSAELGAASLTACGGDQPNLPTAGLIAPSQGQYSLSTTPQYFKNLDEAIDQMQGYFGNYMPDGASQSIETLRKQPVAEWIGGDVGPDRVTQTIETSDNSIPVFVLYHIPDRDLDQYSAGGAGGDDEYKTWAKSVSSAIGDEDAVVIIEPDAIPHMDELGDAEADDRASLLAFVLKTFADDNPNTAVYLDAGNSAWLSPEKTAGLLKKVSAAGSTIPGIALNVSNFQSEMDTRAYSEAISKAYGEDLYTIIDESRNGAPAPNRQWCNPEWARTGTPIDDQFDPQERFEQLYIKRPGESDGQCGVSQAPAGQFDPMLLWRLLGETDLIR